MVPERRLSGRLSTTLLPTSPVNSGPGTGEAETCFYQFGDFLLFDRFEQIKDDSTVKDAKHYGAVFYTPEVIKMALL